MAPISIAATDRVFVLTGAGISAESGLPTFRASDGLWALRRPTQRASIFQAREQLREGHAEHGGDLRQVFEADVLFATLDLADVGSVEPADVGELLLRPFLGRPKLLDAPAQKYQ